MNIRFRPMSAAVIALALCAYAADQERTLAHQPAAPSAGLQQQQAATGIAVVWTMTAASQVAAPRHASWDALMQASWR